MASRKLDISKLRPEKDLITILDDLDFSWYPEEIEKAQEMWEEGSPIDEISRKVEREGDEVFLLLMDLARRGKIESRPGDIWGN